MRRSSPIAQPRTGVSQGQSSAQICDDGKMHNVLSVDIEDYFHVEAFASKIPIHSWECFVPRLEENVDRILELFDKHKTKGTFFVLGWVAERHPGLARRISEAGHEIGCHSFAHQRLHRLTPEEFRADVRRARKLLMDDINRPVTVYRAPTFSVVRQTSWAFDILAEEGFRIDSSVFPVHHELYGIPDAERSPHWRATSQGGAIFEFPPSTVRRARNNWGVGGGGYLRLLPYSLTRWAIRQINEQEGQPAMVYFHPWEIDPGQPRLSVGLRSRLRHYTNLSKMENRIEQLLLDFRFSTLSDVCSRLEVYRAGPCPFVGIP
jgi:polysaccharide deacetylase family protein (PEP-CTERM system associated)